MDITLSGAVAAVCVWCLLNGKMLMYGKVTQQYNRQLPLLFRKTTVHIVIKKYPLTMARTLVKI